MCGALAPSSLLAYTICHAIVPASSINCCFWPPQNPKFGRIVGVWIDSHLAAPLHQLIMCGDISIEWNNPKKKEKVIFHSERKKKDNATCPRKVGMIWPGAQSKVQNSFMYQLCFFFFFFCSFLQRMQESFSHILFFSSVSITTYKWKWENSVSQALGCLVYPSSWLAIRTVLHQAVAKTSCQNQFESAVHYIRE